MILSFFLLSSIPLIFNVNGCKLTEFTCTNKRCITQDKYCNSISDCSDGSDEPRSCSQCNRTYRGEIGASYTLSLHQFNECQIVFLGTASDEIIQIRTSSTHETKVLLTETSQHTFLTPFIYFSNSNEVRLNLNSSYDLEISYKFLKKTRQVNKGILLPSTYCSFTYNDCPGCVLESPNYPGSFPANVTCYYAIKSSKLISLLIPGRFREESYLSVYDGYTIMDKLLVRVENDVVLANPVVGSGGELLVEFWSGNGRGEPFEIKIGEVEPNDFTCNEKISSLKRRSGLLQSPRYTLPPNTTCSVEFTGSGPEEILKIQIYKFFIDESDCDSSYLDLSEGNKTVARLCYNSTYKICEHKLKFGFSARECNERESYLLETQAVLSFRLQLNTVITPFQYSIGFEFIRGRECWETFTSSSSFIAPRNPYRRQCNFTFLYKGRIEVNDFVGSKPMRIYEYVLGTRYLRSVSRNYKFDSIDRVEIIIEDSPWFTGRYTTEDTRDTCGPQKAVGSGHLTLNECSSVFLVSPKREENYLHLRIPSCANLRVYGKEEKECRPELYSANWANETYSRDYFIVQYSGQSSLVVHFLEIARTDIGNCRVCPGFACIDPALFCDSIPDCPGGFDETDCGRSHLWLLLALVLLLCLLIAIVCVWRGANGKGID